VDGTILPCAHCATIMGNLHENTFSEIWNNPAYRSFRRAGMLRPKADLLRGCDCANCCQVADNRRVEKIFGRIRPWVASGLSSTTDNSLFGDANPTSGLTTTAKSCGKPTLR
jgi:hypothetical protein